MPLTIHELLADKVYKEFFMTKPKVVGPPGVSPAWWLYLQRESEGKWARTSADTYVQAYKLLRPRLGDYHDLVIVSKRQAFAPPHKTVRVAKRGQPVMVKDGKGKLVQQTKLVHWSPMKLIAEAELSTLEVQRTRWCMYCRRPTLFTFFPKHHAFGGAPAYDMTRKRCHVCGIAEEGGAR